MKTRILHTKFWSDAFINDCSPSEKLIYLYFLTNEKINLCGIYEISPREVSFYTGIPIDEVKQTTEKLKNAKKMFFWNGWVCVLNHEKYNSYGNGKDQVKAYIREFGYIPQDFWDAMSEWDTSLYTSLYTRYNTKTINPNKENISVLGSEVEFDKISEAVFGKRAE